MPFYEYRCDRGHTFEVLQRMSDDPVSTCTTCEAPVQRVLQPIAVHFKGSGFYTTDYGKRKSGVGGESGSDDGAKREGAKSDDAKSNGAKGGTGSDSGKKSESSAAKSGATD